CRFQPMAAIHGGELREIGRAVDGRREGAPQSIPRPPGQASGRSSQRGRSKSFGASVKAQWSQAGTGWRTALLGRLPLLTARKGRLTWRPPPVNGCPPAFPAVILIAGRIQNHL